MIPVLQIGKIYVDTSGRKAQIVAVDNGIFIGRLNLIEPDVFDGTQKLRYHAYIVDGTSIDALNTVSILKEYKEPVVHRYDIVLIRPSVRHGLVSSDERQAVITPVGDDYKNHYWTEVSRKTVEFTE